MNKELELDVIIINAKNSEPGMVKSRTFHKFPLVWLILFLNYFHRLASLHSEILNFPELTKALSSPSPFQLFLGSFCKNISEPTRQKRQGVSWYDIVYYCTLCLQLQHSKFRLNLKFLTILNFLSHVNVGSLLDESNSTLYSRCLPKQFSIIYHISSWFEYTNRRRKTCS